MDNLYIVHYFHINETENTRLEEEWWEINNLVNSWILNTIEPSLPSTIYHSERADELWIDLKERFLVGTGPQIYELKAALANCKQGGDSVHMYFSRLKKLWDELENYTQLPSSTDTELLTFIIKERENEKKTTLEMALPSPSPEPPPLEETAEFFLQNFTVPTANRLDTTSPDASSLWVIRSGGHGIHPNSSPAAASHRQTTAKFGAAADLGEAEDSTCRRQDLTQQIEGDRWRRGQILPQSGKHVRRQKFSAEEICVLGKKMVAGRADRSTVTDRAASRSQAATGWAIPAQAPSQL
ncbi:hypothetical protein M9H77_13563 [Catharanthus roseus]|uniref:Uncharacterized protein n=1 Tax=Catharanthus roseus TaxID=4058 RepID=A0ACC0BKR1_CATRO|nr:hypothetical protein M9H77_13563 [Catharanthus roseus]